MITETVVVRGLVRADGTLELPGKVTLTPGPVEVTVRAAPITPAISGDWWDSLQKLRAEQAGHIPRSKEHSD